MDPNRNCNSVIEYYYYYYYYNKGLIFPYGPQSPTAHVHITAGGCYRQASE